MTALKSVGARTRPARQDKKNKFSICDRGVDTIREIFKSRLVISSQLLDQLSQKTQGSTKPVKFPDYENITGADRCNCLRKAEPNLQVALNLVQQAMKAVGPIGAVMNIKDDDWLKRSNVSKGDLADFCLKSLELPAWNRLKALLGDVIAKPVLVDLVLRKQRVNLLIDALTRVTG